jgi:RNA polymerase sigma-70 factor (ECF subfamily)
MGLGKKNEWYAMYLQNRRALVDYAAPLTKSRDEAEDVVQEAFLHFMPKEHDQPVPPKAYLFRIVRNLSFNRKRHQKVKNAAHPDDLPWWTQYQTVDTPEDHLLFCEQVRIAAHVLENLPPQMRLVMELYRFEGKTMEDIAERMDISISTVHRLLKEAMKKIREKMAIDL